MFMRACKHACAHTAHTCELACSPAFARTLRKEHAHMHAHQPVFVSMCSVAALQACRGGLQRALAALHSVHALAKGSASTRKDSAADPHGRKGQEPEQEVEGHGLAQEGVKGHSGGAKEEALRAIAAILEEGGGGHARGGRQLQAGHSATRAPVLGALQGLLAGLDAKLPELERAVQIQQQPSRVLRWAAAGAPSY